MRPYLRWVKVPPVLPWRPVVSFGLVVFLDLSRSELIGIGLDVILQLI